MAGAAPLGFHAAQYQLSQKSRDVPCTITFQPPPSNDLDSSTFNWYRSLTSKKVQSLQIHKSDPYFIILSMWDGLLFKLESPYNKSVLPTATSISSLVATRIYDTSGSDFTSTQWISIELVQGSPITDLKFILAICHGASKTFQRSSKTYGVYDKTLFALAIATSVARHCIQFENNLIDSAGPSLRAHLPPGFTSQAPQFVSQSLWEKDIVTEARNELRRQLVDDSKQRIKDVLAQRTILVAQTNKDTKPEKGPQPNENTKPEKDRLVSTTAASIVAWLETSASPKSIGLITWETKWEATWRENWKKNWEKSWNRQLNLPRIALINLGKIADIDALVADSFTTAVTASARLSGKYAGSTTLETEQAKRCACMPPESYLVWGTQSGGGENTPGKLVWDAQDLKSDYNMFFTFTATCGYDSADFVPSWLESWRLLRCYGSQQDWLPVWETAANLAWAIGWEIAVKEGRDKSQKPAHSTMETTQEPIQEIAPSFYEVVKSALERQRQWRPTVLEETKRHEKIIQHRKANQYKELVKLEEIGSLKEYLLDHAKNNADGTGSTLEALANRAFDLARETNKGVNLENLLHAQTTWVKVYRTTWENTWKKCWEESWHHVLEETFKIVWERGFLEGMSLREDHERDPNPADPEPFGAKAVEYPHLEEYLQIRSSFKALDSLHRTLTHSVPTRHKDGQGLKITIAEDKASVISPIHVLLLIEYSANQYKAFTRTKSGIVQNKPQYRLLTHSQFQGEIESMVKENLGNKPFEKAARLMNEIWKSGTDTYGAPSFIPSEDVQPQNHIQDTHPMEQPLRQRNIASMTGSLPPVDQPPTQGWRQNTITSMKRKFTSLRARDAGQQKSRGNPFASDTNQEPEHTL